MILKRLMKARIVSTLLLTISFQTKLPAGTLRKVWELNLLDAIKDSGGKERGWHFGVTALRFSPNGGEIAVATNPERIDGDVTSHLLVVRVERPRERIRRFEIAQLALDSEVLGARAPAVGWSPAGDLILAGSNLVHLKDGKICRIEHGPNFGWPSVVGVDGVVALEVVKAGHYRFDLFGADCVRSGTWAVGEGEWSISDVSADRGLVSALRKTGQENVESMVVDPVAQKVIQQWPASRIGYNARFAEYGKVLCAGDTGPDYSNQSDRRPRCMDVSTGDQVAEVGTIDGGAPFAAAEHASRIVATDHRPKWNLRFRENDNVVKRRVVWDFRSGAEVASWTPESQSYSLPGLIPLVKELFVVAISPDGQYVAEGGNNTLRLYKIEP